MKFTRAFGVGLSVLAVVVLAAALLETGGAQRPAPRPAARSGNESYAKTNAAGFEAEMQRLRGRVVVLTFWGTWCGPCRMEIPHLIQLLTDHKAEGLSVVSVADDIDSEQTLREFEQKAQVDLPYPVFFDETMSIQRAYNVRSLPRTVIFDRRGRERKVYEGYGPGLEYEVDELVAQLLKEQ